MKKIFPILLLSMILGVFSSCIIVPPESVSTNYYYLTCHNVSDTRITDWCVVKDGKVTFAKNKHDYCPITANGGTSTLSLPEGEYYLYCAFVSNPDYEYGDYIQSKKIDLRKDYDVYIDQTFVDEYWTN